MNLKLLSNLWDEVETLVDVSLDEFDVYNR